MSDDSTETLPPRRRFWRILVFLNIRSLFLCSALLLFASVAYAAGSYQRTRDGKALIWNESPKRGEEATWSGKRDKKGYAVGLVH